MYIEQREDILTSRILNNMGFLTQWENEFVRAEIIVASQKFPAKSDCFCVFMLQEYIKRFLYAPRYFTKPPYFWE